MVFAVVSHHLGGPPLFRYEFTVLYSAVACDRRRFGGHRPWRAGSDESDTTNSKSIDISGLNPLRFFDDQRGVHAGETTFRFCVSVHGGQWAAMESEGEAAAHRRGCSGGDEGLVQCFISPAQSAPPKTCSSCLQLQFGPAPIVWLEMAINVLGNYLHVVAECALEVPVPVDAKEFSVLLSQK